MERSTLKKSIFSLYILFIGCSFSSNAAFLKTYDDLKKTTIFSESHYVSYVDQITMKGGGLFSWDANELSEEVWGLIMKSDQKKAGSWVRQNVTSLNPDWFGARHLKNATIAMQLSFAALGYTTQEIRSRYGIYINDISINDYPDWAAMQMMCKLQEKGWLSIELPSGEYFINRSIILPEPTQASKVVQYSIEGNGSWFYSTSEQGFPFFYTMPQDQKESQNVFCARRFTIRNLSIVGKKSAIGSIGIEIGGTFQTLIENIHLLGLDTGIVLRHAMSSTILRCNSVGCKHISYFLGSGRGAWEGGNSTNSGSNQSAVVSCRQFSAEGQYAGVYITESSECRVENFVLDGGGKRHTSYCIYIDTRNATTVKDGYISGIHGEAGVDSSLVKFRGNNASFVVENLFVQYPCNLVELDGNSQIRCAQFSYFPGECTFSNKGNGTWKFENVFNRAKDILWKSDASTTIPEERRVTNDKRL